MSKQEEIAKFLEKVKKLEKGEKLDLSSDEDLSVAIMNLISMEEHFFFTYSKTKEEKYLKYLDEVRELRKELLRRIVKDYEGEVWCISKHLLAASMRLIEVGTKFLTKKDEEGAKEMFEKAYGLYSLFWGLNLGVVKTGEIKKNQTEEITFLEEKGVKVKGKMSVFEKLGEMVKKVIDCCIE